MPALSSEARAFLIMSVLAGMVGGLMDQIVDQLSDVPAARG